jgi:hypothetical protein
MLDEVVRKITAVVMERDYAAKDASILEPDPCVMAPPKKRGGIDGES